MRWRRSKPGGHAAEDADSAVGIPRPKRFPIHIPVRYRRNGDTHWHRGTTENLSVNGVLLRASRNLQPEFRLTLRFVLPPDLAGRVTVQVQCEGQVVREKRLENDISAFGVALTRIRLLGAAESDTAAEHLAETTHQPLAAFVHRLSSDLSIIVGKCELLVSQGTLDPATVKAIEQIKRAAMNAAESARQVV